MSYCSIRSVPLAVIKFLIIFMFVGFLIKRSFRDAVPGQGSHRCMMHLFLSVLQTIFLVRYLYAKSQSVTSTRNTIYLWALQIQAEWVISEPARTNHMGLKAQIFENPIFKFWCFSLKPVRNSCKLPRHLQIAQFFIIYSSTHTNIVFLFRYQATEIVIFIKVCCQMECFSGDSFYFFRNRFC